jgi:hypothetical protein
LVCLIRDAWLITRERYLAAATYLSSRAFPSRLLRLPDEGQGRVDAQAQDVKEIRGVKTITEEDSYPVLLPALDLFNRMSTSSSIGSSPDGNKRCPWSAHPMAFFTS